MADADVIEPETIVRRALYDRLPAAAFTIHNGVDMLAVGVQYIDFQKLCDGIVADLIAADWICGSD